MSISILQQPLELTPTNAQHVYNVISNLSGQTDFRYVFDIWIDPYQSSAEKVARIKVAPNTTGNGIVDVGEIVKNYIKPNPRSALSQNINGSNTGSSTTPNGIITNTYPTGYILSNQFNSNTNYEKLRHVGEYRVVIGEEYTTSGGTTLTICDNAYYPPSSLLTYTTDESVAYSGSPNTIEVEDAGSNIPYYNTFVTPGFTFLHTTSGGSLVYSSSTTSTSGTYTASASPSNGDYLYVIENYSDVTDTYEWNAPLALENGWTFKNRYTGGSCMWNGDLVTIWPGVQENKTNHNYNNSYWSGNTDGQNNHLYYEGYKYRFVGYPISSIDDNTPAQFLTTFGDNLYTSSFLGTLSGWTSNRVRRRTHHYQCPVITSHFWGDVGTYQNETGLLVPYEYSTDQNGVYQVKAALTGFTYTASTQLPDYRIVYTTYPFNSITSGGKLATWRSEGTTTQIYDDIYRQSEVIEYYFYGDDCMSDPQHFLFLNRNGVWDTWTFDRKNIKTYNKQTETYAQGRFRDSSVFNPFFYDKRAVIYDQYTTERVEAQSHYITENDRKIVEEMFLSTEVFLIQNNYYNNDGSTNYSKTPYLIPIVITSNSLQEYKQRYNKVFQYTLSYEYNPNQLFRTTL